MNENNYMLTKKETNQICLMLHNVDKYQQKRYTKVPNLHNLEPKSKQYTNALVQLDQMLTSHLIMKGIEPKDYNKFDYHSKAYVEYRLFEDFNYKSSGEENSSEPEESRATKIVQMNQQVLMISLCQFQ